jgi:hypothetical protein
MPARRTRRSIRAAALIVLKSSLMFRKIAVSIAVGLALCAATVRLPASSCILSNASSPTACQPGCCANKNCCETSHERTGPPGQPLAKSSIDQQNISATPATVAVAPATPAATIESRFFSSAEWVEHSPTPLELICIRLI